MTIPIDLTGQRFGRLRVVRSEKTEKGLRWLCLCDCGNTPLVASGGMRTGRTRSCGCLHIEATRARRLRHGMSGTTEYRIWKSMVARCENPKRGCWHHYGGRGIKVCARWRASFDLFFADMGHRPSPRHTIDRINNDGDYEPGNCRWATQAEQLNNKRCNVLLTFNGETLTQSQWARRLGISHGTLSWRVKKHGVTRALSMPRRAAFARRKAHENVEA